MFELFRLLEQLQLVLILTLEQVFEFGVCFGQLALQLFGLLSVVHSEQVCAKQLRLLKLLQSFLNQRLHFAELRFYLLQSAVVSVG